MATGEVWLGVAALNKQLVDQLMTSDEYLSQRAREANLYHLHFAERKSLQERVGLAASGSLEHLAVKLWSRLSGRLW
ncbi:putative inner membrane peptidase [compost metagenome]